MKFLFDLFPVLLFFGTYLVTEDMFVATAVIIPASVAQLSYVWIRHRRLDKMLLFSTTLVLIMGGLTLYTHDKHFIMWKPTILYWCFAMVLSGSAMFWKKNLIKSILGKELSAPDSAWSFLNWSWVIFFLVLGGVNLYIAYNLSERSWAFFKVWGGLGCTFAFAIAQAFYLTRFMEEKDTR